MPVPYSKFDTGLLVFVPKAIRLFPDKGRGPLPPKC